MSSELLLVVNQRVGSISFEGIWAQGVKEVKAWVG